MSEGAQNEPSEGGEDEEVLDGIPVLAEPPRIIARDERQSALERHSATVIPAVQAAAVAAGGFVAGAAVVGLVHRRQQRALAKGRGRGGRLARSQRGGSRAGELVQIVSSRSLLLDVHLLGGADADR